MKLTTRTESIINARTLINNTTTDEFERIRVQPDITTNGYHCASLGASATLRLTSLEAIALIEALRKSIASSKEAKDYKEG